ncbi:MAG: diphthine synthase [Candidatus Marsarchaeota archaeon]|jgi:diphthine synthase|nr:diphthine synthase [Candidatus Marsarchaeota archaeon]MCL5431199.1 diphthine synthase [Candidatus Marsarchaeota archaeon]
MLYLIGTGISGELSKEAQKICSLSKVYIDSYTSLTTKSSMDSFSKQIGTVPEPLQRSMLEEGSKSLAFAALKSDIAVLVPGDPLMATTHKTLLEEAAAAGAKWKVLHSSSIASAALGESMLDFYRFGRVATIARWSDHYKPVSFYEALKSNYDAGLHTLFLLDYDSDEGRSMDFGEVSSILAAAEEEYEEGLLAPESRAIFMHNIGLEGQAVVKGTVSSIPSLGFGRGLNSMIIPAALSYIEEELTAALLKGEW